MVYTKQSRFSPLRFWVGIAKLNAAEKHLERTGKATIGRLEMSYRIRQKGMLMGRFGGGWNWKLGVSVGGNCAIFDLLTFAVRVTWKEKSAPSVTDGRA